MLSPAPHLGKLALEGHPSCASLQLLLGSGAREGLQMGVLVVHGAGYERDAALRFLQRQRLRSGLLAGFVAAEQLSPRDALNEGAEGVPFPVQMVEYSDALNSPSTTESQLPTPADLADPHDWQPIPKARCLCCFPRRSRVRANVRDWTGNVAKDLPSVTASVIERRLPDVHRYVTRGEGRTEAIATVHDALTPDIRVVLGHSLGSVVVVDALARVAQDSSPQLLVTIGSPLRFEAIRRRIDAATTNWIRQRPIPWINVHDRGDVVTAGGSLPVRHFPGVINVSVDNGDHSHAGDYYLRHPIIGRLIWDVATGDLAPQQLRSGIPPAGAYGTLFKDR
jgi:hypothetical protein